MKVEQQKIKVFHEKNIPVHISTKKGEWINGYISDAGNEDFFMVKDFVRGEMPVFYLEIHRIDKYKQKEKSDEKKI